MMTSQQQIVQQRRKTPSASWPAAMTKSRPAPTRRRPIWPWIVIIAALLTIGLLMLTIAGAWTWLDSEEIMPGVQIFGVHVGGRTQTEAEAILREQWGRPSIVLENGVDSWAVSPEALGLELDVEATLDQAHQVGRSLASLVAWVEDHGQTTLLPIWHFDADRAESTLEALAPSLSRAPVDARIEIVDGQAVAIEPVPGQQLDVSGSLAALAADPGGYLAGKHLLLKTRPIWPQITDASGLAVELNELLKTTIELQAYDPIIDETVILDIPPEEWSEWLRLELTDRQDERPWSIDELALGRYLTENAPALGPDRYLDVDDAREAVLDIVDRSRTQPALRIYHRQRSYTVQTGESLSTIGQRYGIPYPWIQQANPDLSETLFAGQTLTIPSPDDLLPLPIINGKRIVVSIAEQRVRVYEHGQLIWDWPASTGINESPTATGIFQIQSHEPLAYASNWDLWMPNFMGVYHPVPMADFMNGFHGFPNRGGRDLLWTGNLGSKVTYGCILLSSDNAATLFDWAEAGVLVEIKP